MKKAKIHKMTSFAINLSTIFVLILANVFIPLDRFVDTFAHETSATTRKHQEISQLRNEVAEQRNNSERLEQNETLPIENSENDTKTPEDDVEKETESEGRSEAGDFIAELRQEEPEIMDSDQVPIEDEIVRTTDVKAPSDLENVITRLGDRVNGGDSRTINIQFKESPTIIEEDEEMIYEYQYKRWDLESQQSSGGFIVLSQANGDGFSCDFGDENNSQICNYAREFFSNEVEIARMRTCVETPINKLCSDWTNWQNGLDWSLEDVDYDNWKLGRGAFGNDYSEDSGGYYLVEVESPISTIHEPKQRDPDEPLEINPIPLSIRVSAEDDNYTEVKEIELTVYDADRDPVWSYDISNYSGEIVDLEIPFDNIYQDHGAGDYCIQTIAEDVADDGAVDGGIGNREIKDGCDLEVRVIDSPPPPELESPTELTDKRITHNGDVETEDVVLKLEFKESQTFGVHYQYEYKTWDLERGIALNSEVIDLEGRILNCDPDNQVIEVCQYWRDLASETLEIGRIRAGKVIDGELAYSDWSNWTDLETFSSVSLSEVDYSAWASESGLFGRQDYIAGEGGYYIHEDIAPISYISDPQSSPIDIYTTQLDIEVDSYEDDYTQVKLIDIYQDNVLVDTIHNSHGTSTLSFPGSGTYCINAVAEDIADDGNLDEQIGNREKVDFCDLVVEVHIEEELKPVIDEFNHSRSGDILNLEVVSSSPSQIPIKIIDYEVEGHGRNIIGSFVSSQYGSDYENVEGLASISGVYAWETGYYTVKICAEDTNGNRGDGYSSSLPTEYPDECYEKDIFIDNTAPPPPPPPKNHKPVITNKLSDKKLKEGSNVDDTFSVEDIDGNLEGIYYYVEQLSGIATPGFPKENAFQVSGSSYSINFSQFLGLNRVDTSRLYEGDYVIYVMAWDEYYTYAEQFFEFEVENDDPDIEDLETNYTHVYEGTKVEFEGEFEDGSDIADNPDDAEWYMEVDYDDGDEYKKTGIDDTGDLDIKSHRFDEDGVYEVEIKVCEAETDDNWLSENECDEKEVTIYVYDYIPPVDPVDPEEEEEEKEGEEIPEEVPEDEQVDESGEVLGEDTCDESSKVKVFGYVYNDANKNSVYDDGEPGAGGVEIKLLKDVNGNTEVMASVKSQEDGYWEMMSCEGSYKVQIDSSQLPSGTQLESLQTQSILVDDQKSNQVDFQFSLKNNILNWLTQNCLWAVLGVIALVLLVVLAAVIVNSGDGRRY